MNKHEKLFDSVIWFIIYSLPLLLLLFVKDFTDLSSVFESLKISFYNTPIFNGLFELFDASSSTFIGIEISPHLLVYLTYLITCYFIHIFVDVLLFVPRWCLKLINKGE